MYYRLTYQNNNTTLSRELSANKDQAEENAWQLLAEQNEIGQVIIERRESEYYGDYKHYLTISKSKDNPVSNNGNGCLSYLIPYTRNYSSRWSDELHPFTQMRLDKEEKDVRRLVWICQIKKAIFPNSPVKAEYNSKRDEQVTILKNNGYSYGTIAYLAEKYKCIMEFLSG